AGDDRAARDGSGPRMGDLRRCRQRGARGEVRRGNEGRFRTGGGLRVGYEIRVSGHQRHGSPLDQASVSCSCPAGKVTCVLARTVREAPRLPKYRMLPPLTASRMAHATMVPQVAEAMGKFTSATFDVTPVVGLVHVTGCRA